MRKITLICGALALIGLLGTSARAETLRVGKGKPYATIGDAVAAASADDTIVVGKGRYTETVEVMTPGLTFKAKKGVKWMPEAWRGQCLTLRAEAEGATITGFAFRGLGTGIRVEAEKVTISKCSFRGGDGVVGQGGNGLLISRCDFRWGGSALDVDADGVTFEFSRVSHFNSGPVEITGNDARLYKVTVNGSSDDAGIDVRGDRAIIEMCRTRATWNQGIEVDGDDCVVRKNRIDDVLSSGGITVDGDRVLVEDNVITGVAWASGIDVGGQTFTIRGNRVYDVGSNVPGIFAGNGAGGGGAATVEGNLVIGSVGDGIEVSGAAITVTGNRVENCSVNGIRVHGSGHVLRDNIVVGIGHYGFFLDTASADATGCSAEDCSIDGFRVEAMATGVVLRDCRATGCGAEGLHNSGETSFSDCTFVGNRQDVANDIGTLTDGGGNTFETGGVTSPPVH